MKLRRSTSAPTPASPPTDDRLHGLTRMHLDDDDERPSREDLDYGQTIFTRPPVPLPKFLAGKKRRS
jgi:hypothetical protein